jgi:hypothetical protein
MGVATGGNKGKRCGARHVGVGVGVGVASASPARIKADPRRPPSLQRGARRER